MFHVKRPGFTRVLKSKETQQGKLTWKAVPSEMRNPDAFCDLVIEQMERLNMSAPDVVRASRKRVSTSTVWNIRNKQLRNIDSETIEALAPAIKLPADLLFDVAYNLRRDVVDPDEMKLIIFYRNVPVERQSDIMDFVGAMNRRHALGPIEKIETALKKRKRVA